MAQDPNRIRRINEDFDDEPKEKKTINPYILAIGSVIVAVVVVFLMFNPGGKMDKTEVQKQLDAQNVEITKQLTDSAVKFNKLQTDIMAANDKQIKDATAKFPDTQVAFDAKSTANTAKSIADTAKSTSDSANANAIQAQKSSDAVQTNLNNFKTDYDKKFADSTTSMADLKKQVVDLTTKVNDIPTSTTSSSSTSTTGTGTATNGQVTATIVSYSSSVYGGLYNNNMNPSSGSVLSISPVKDVTYESGDTQSKYPNDTLIKIGDGTNAAWFKESPITTQFQLQITNNTGKTISSINLGLAFIFIDGYENQIDVPYTDASTYVLGSMGNPQWTVTGSSSNYASWATGANNSVLAGLWNFTQGVGTSTYYSTFKYTLPVNGTFNTAQTLPTSPFYAVPILKINGYTTN